MLNVFPLTVLPPLFSTIFSSSYMSLPIPHFSKNYLLAGASQVALVVKNQPANAGDIRDAGLIRELGRSPG